jgi:hypothetical protein
MDFVLGLTKGKKGNDTCHNPIFYSFIFYFIFTIFFKKIKKMMKKMMMKNK